MSKYLSITQRFLILVVICVFATDSLAESRTARLQPNLVIGDGKNGNRFANWSQPTDSRSIDSVSVRVRKVKGGDTYLNLRFQGGETFENGRRAYLTDPSPQTITWQLNGEPSNNQPLLLQAYHGEVLVEAVEIRYLAHSNPSLPGGSGIHIPGVIISPKSPPTYDDVDENAAAIRACRKLRVRRPSIVIEQAEPASRSFGEYRVEGTIQGQCIEEVGYYESGRLREPIRFPLDDRFLRRQFQVRVDLGRRPELRAYTMDGRQEVIDLESELSRWHRPGRYN